MTLLRVKTERDVVDIGSWCYLSSSLYDCSSYAGLWWISISLLFEWYQCQCEAWNDSKSGINNNYWFKLHKLPVKLDLLVRTFHSFLVTQNFEILFCRGSGELRYIIPFTHMAWPIIWQSARWAPVSTDVLGMEGAQAMECASAKVSGVEATVQ